MARPTKQGLDYFPLDVNFLKDIKVRKIKRACGPATIEILLCLLGNIYRDTGYYFGWDEEAMFLVADEVGAKEGLVEEIVNKAVKVGFFNQDKFEKYKILTSRGIQNRYREATQKRKKIVISDIYLINDEFTENKPQLSENKLADNSINSTVSTQSKVKKSKQKESKEKESSSGNSELAKLKDFYVQNFGMMSPLTYDDLQHSLTDYGFDLSMEAMIRAVRQQKSFSTALSILKYWSNNGIKTLEDAMAERAAFERKKTGYSAQKKQSNKTSKDLPKWSDGYKLNQAGVDITGLSQNEMYKLAEEMGLHNDDE